MMKGTTEGTTVTVCCGLFQPTTRPRDNSICSSMWKRVLVRHRQFSSYASASMSKSLSKLCVHTPREYRDWATISVISGIRHELIIECKYYTLAYIEGIKGFDNSFGAIVDTAVADQNA